MPLSYNNKEDTHYLKYSQELQFLGKKWENHNIPENKGMFCSHRDDKGRLPNHGEIRKPAAQGKAKNCTPELDKIKVSFDLKKMDW